MANNEGRRAVTQDPLAPNVRERSPDRSLQLAGVHAAQTPSAASLTPQDGLTQAMQGVEGVLAQAFEKKKDEWITQGKVAYQSGVTESAILESGNEFTAQGYRTLQARDRVNNWFTNQTIDMDTNGAKTDPKTYATQLQAQRKEVLSTITDPYAQKVASAAFEEMSPRLASSQAIKHNEYNRVETNKAFTSTLVSVGSTSTTASRTEPGNPLLVSPVPVGPTINASARDRDIGIRTMLGEAANEGAEGLAAVAHVIKNRTTDARWPGTVEGVSMQPKQFSAWNEGAGGNSIPRSVKPGDPLYERAGQIFDTVMSGKHTDPTGGATHYYSPAGMNKLVADGDQANTIPKWLDEETARGGGRIKIGGHIFVGKSSGTDQRDEKSYDTKLSPDEEKSFQTWKAANAPNDSGADYDLRGAFKAGVAPDPKNGHWPDTYKKPNHPTFSDQSQYAVGADKAKAGKWDGDTFVPAPNAPPRQNEVMEFINRSTLKDKDKATSVADAMRRSLDIGDDKLFNDVGGVSVLHKLGAQPGEIDEVLKAKKRFDDKKLTEFSIAGQQFENDIKKRAEDGEDLNTILSDIDKRHKSGLLNDANARSLATTAADKIRAQDKDKSQLGNPDLLNELGGLYQQVATGTDPMTLAPQAKKIAEKYGATEKDVSHVIAKMFTDNQSYQNNLRATATAAAKDKATQDGIKGEVDRALAKGSGLGLVTGSVKIAGEGGLPKTVSAEDYGVAQVKDKWAKLYSDKVNSGEITIGQAKPELERKVALELQNHGLVDKQMGAQLQGSLAGNIIGKDGLVKKEASQAYESWLALRTGDNIRPEYLAKLVPDNGVRTLLEQAYLLDSGTLSKEQSLVKAHEILNDPNRDPNDRIAKDAVWRTKLDVDLKKTLLERTAPSFFSRMFATNDRSEVERILTNNKAAENYVTMRAEAYHFQNPNEHGEVSLEKAMQDLQAHSVPVMGNLIITKPGKELDKTMGVSGFGNNAVQDAFTQFMQKNGEKIWGKSYTDRDPSAIGSALNKISELDTALSPQGIAAGISPKTFDNAANYKGSRAKSPPMSMTYNAELGVMTVDLYKDADMRQTLGAPKHFNVRSIGAEYAKQQTTPTDWAKTWNGIFKATGKALSGDNMENVYNAN